MCFGLLSCRVNSIPPVMGPGWENICLDVLNWALVPPNSFRCLQAGCNPEGTLLMELCQEVAADIKQSAPNFGVYNNHAKKGTKEDPSISFFIAARSDTDMLAVNLDECFCCCFAPRGNALRA